MFEFASRTAVFVSAVIMAAGCSNDHEPAAPYRIPDRAQFSYRWSAAAGLPLDSDPAIVTRATIESAFIAAAGKTTDKPDDSTGYPGYKHAVAPTRNNPQNYRERSGSIDYLYDAWNSSNLSSHGSIQGTVYAYLVSLQKAPGDQPVHTMDAMACVWFNGLTASSSSGDFHSLMVAVPDAVTLKMWPMWSSAPAPGPARRWRCAGPMSTSSRLRRD
ncbi:hypothetical protein [Nocardia aurantiaca]|uniref:hypothetical protein n=1 Tax=Nocardia aurantiaca TaxID=2675850 RepID=UPI0018A8FC10|nr:hypothetical protein [Nocardia aurantiaca]